MRIAALVWVNLAASAALAQTAEPLDQLNEALAASENLAVAAAQSPDPLVAEAARQAHFQFLRAAAAFRASPYLTPTPMDPLTFGFFLKELGSGRHLTEDRIAIIARSAARHLFSVEQVVSLMDLFSLDREKIQVAAVTYEHVLDPENFQRVYEALTFTLSRDTLGALLAR